MKKLSVVFVLMLIALTTTAFAAANPTAATAQASLAASDTYSDGAPISTCRPGFPCDPVAATRQVASDGAPISTCRPGFPCDPVKIASLILLDCGAQKSDTEVADKGNRT